MVVGVGWGAAPPCLLLIVCLHYHSPEPGDEPGLNEGQPAHIIARAPEAGYNLSMATIAIPILFEELTGGARRAEVPGTTLAEIADALEAAYPGIEKWLRKDDELSPLVAVTVDGKIASGGFATPVQPQSEIRIMPLLGGG